MKKYFIVLALLIAIGIFDTSYLTYEHYNNAIPPCSLHAVFSDCGKVLTSSYATVLTIPVAFFGFLYYVTLSIMLLLLKKKQHILFITLRILTMLGMLISVYFIAIQLFVLHAICVYCTISDSNSILIFFLLFYIIHGYKQKRPRLL